MAFSDESLISLAAAARRAAVRTVLKRGFGHISSSLSLIDIISVLYGASLVESDTFSLRGSPVHSLVLSKAHGLLAIYSILGEMGVLSSEMADFPLEPDPRICPQAGFATGPLGGGLALAIGLSIGFARHHGGVFPRIRVIVGDGECQKGQILESIQLAAKLSIGGLLVIVDHNRLQLDGQVEDVQSTGPEWPWEGSGWLVKRLDGHCIPEILNAIVAADQSDLPAVIIADTVKGKGISKLEGRAHYHYYKHQPDFRLILEEWLEMDERDREGNATDKTPS